MLDGPKNLVSAGIFGKIIFPVSDEAAVRKKYVAGPLIPLMGRLSIVSSFSRFESGPEWDEC